MRISLFRALTAIILAGTATAQAADLDYGVLRGPEEDVYVPPPVWTGFYIGGHGGYTSANLDAGRALMPHYQRLLAYTIDEKEFGLSGWLAPGAVRAQSGTYGVFAGYNFQFDEAVIGLEMDYTHGVLRGGANDVIARSYVTSDGWANSAVLRGNTSTSLTDYGTIRGRVGYALGNFLPFVTTGAAFGRAVVADTAFADLYGYDKTTADANAANGGSAYVGKRSFTNQIVKSGERYTFGFAAGTGIDYAVTQNIMVRAEYQYVQFNPFDGHKINVNTVRAGAAIKF